ncbi:hypothetical protein [uncultured Acinetobacter sp.]|uniref:hypothetical protein n=1 Tax=uncultured Acinetobacter sp. TaxID=165433 RepID=UPI002591109B|nr:hypothetical protein [uncultured Acinetobacter sp.]
MTVQVADRLSQLYVGNGANTRFDFIFRVFNQEDETGVAVRVQVDNDFEFLDESKYTVTVNQDSLGGYVTFNEAPSNQTYFYIAGKTPVDQLLDITNYDNFYPDSLERALDKITAILQEWNHLVDFETKARILADIAYDDLAKQREADLKAYIDGIASAVVGNPVLGLPAEFVVDGDKNQHQINADINTEIDKFKSRIKGKFYAVDYGLKTTNTAYQNTIALQQLSTAVKNNNGGHIVLPSGEYLIGHQTLAGSEDKGGSWLYSKYLNIDGCTNPVLIEANQTVFKFKDGMRHGAFDPITGEVVPNGGTIKKYDAGYGRAISITNNENVLITGQLRINGNDANAIVGGTFGDSGRQCVSYGIYATGNKVLRTYGTFVLHNIPLDGLYVASLNQTDSLTDINGVISLKNARQALSLTGGWNQTYSNCYFGKTGMGNFPYSAPAANLDLEAEVTGLIKDIVFNNCVFSDAMGGSVISEFMSVVGVKFNVCLIENSKNVAIYCKSTLEFNDSKINGKVEPFYSKFEENPAKMSKCVISQFMADGSLAYIQGALYSDGGSSVDGFDGNIPKATFSSLVDVDFNYDFNNANNAILLYIASKGRSRNLTFNVKGNPALIPTAELIQFSGTMSIDGFMLNDKSQYVGTLPNLRKAVVGSGLRYLKNSFITKNPNGDENILWRDTYYSAGGRTGWYAGASIDRQGEQLEAKELSVLKNRYATQSFYGGGQIITSTTTGLPTSGWYSKGTIILNCNADIGDPVAWQCKKSGTAGVDAVFGAWAVLVAI